jgi:DNA-directed RNA polymerase specialized sigma24 family protein
MNMTPEETEAITARMNRALTLSGPERDEEIAAVFSAVKDTIDKVILAKVRRDHAGMLDDLRQDTYQELLRSFDPTRPFENFPGFCATVARHRVAAWEQKERKGAMGRSGPIEDAPEIKLAARDDIRLSVETREERRIVRGLLRQLSLDCRIAIIFTFFAEFPSSAREAAELLEKPTTSFQNHLDGCQKELLKKLVAFRDDNRREGKDSREGERLA